MDGFWRAAGDFLVIAGRRADIGDNSQALDVLFDVGVDVRFFNDSDPVRMLGDLKRSVRNMYLCC